MEVRFAKLNFEDFYSARALSTLQEAAKQHSGVLRHRLLSPCFPRLRMHRAPAPWFLVFWERRNGQRVQHNPKNIPGWKMWGDGTRVCFGGGSTWRFILPFCCFPALQNKKCSVKNRISLLLLAALQRPREVKQWPPLLYSEHTLRYRTALFHSVI